MRGLCCLDMQILMAGKDRLAIDEAIAQGYQVVNDDMTGKLPTTDDVFQFYAVPTESVKETEGMKEIRSIVEKIALICLGIKVVVEFKTCEADTAAQYSNKTLMFNVGLFGEDYFKLPLTVSLLDLIIHELGHEKGNHTDHSYHQALTHIGATLALGKIV